MQPSNKLEISTLSDQWSDKDNIILHACFQLLTDCIEKEKLLDIWEWEQNEASLSAKEQIMELYDWWKKRTNEELEGKLNYLLTEGQYEKDNEMLIKLIQVRAYLWS